MRARTLVTVVVPSLASAAIAIVGCSLGLDASLITASDASIGGEGGPNETDGSTDAAGDKPVTPPPAGSCNQDTDCKITSACIKNAHCELTTHLCSFDVCSAPACQSAACDTTSNTCSVPASFGFHASSFKVTAGGVGCGATSSCFAAAFPFLFVGTTNGVVAYQVGDPSNSSPPVVPVTGLPFLPTRIVQSGRRVYFIGNVVGSGPTYHIALAWLDVPGDPFVTAFTVTTAFVSYAFPNVPLAFPGADGAIVLVHPDASKAWPAVLVNAPIVDSSSITLFPSPGIAMGASVVGASGTRLVTYRWGDITTGYSAAFSFENGAGTSSAQNAGESVATMMGTVYPQGFFGAASDGSVVWSAPSTSTPDGGSFTTLSARMTWLVAGAMSTTFDATAKVDLETYSPPRGYGASVAGPLAVIDTNTVMALASAKEDATQSTVQIATRAMMPASVVAGKRYVLPVDINHVAAGASGAYGYVLAQDDVMNQSATVHIFAPTCM